MQTSTKRPSEAIDGLLLLNKPAGLSSNQALQRVKRLLRAKKAGHTGSLDPAATGMLPLCFGEATKVCAFLLDADKTYRVTARLGQATDTGDADGKVVDEQPVPALDAAGWDEILQGFLGESRQVPPMYSALKKDGNSFAGRGHCGAGRHRCTHGQAAPGSRGRLRGRRHAGAAGGRGACRGWP